MKNSKALEFAVGILILLGLLAFMFMSLRVSGLTTGSNPFMHTTYNLSGDFTDVGNLKVRAPVRIAGVQIGTVTGLDLDPQTYQARVIMSIQNTVSIPTDSSVSVTSSGVLGDNYVSIAPGYASTNMKPNDVFTTTYPATSLTSLISTFMSGSSNNKNSGNNSSGNNANNGT